MAESNQVTLNKATVTGGEVVAADTIALKQYQLIKLILGAAGVNSGPVSAANPLPTGDAAAAAALANILAKLSADPSTAAGVTAAANAIVAQIAANLAGTQPVSAAALPLPAGAATQATLADVLAKLIAAPATESGQTAAQAKLDLIEAVLSAWTFIGGAGLVTPQGGYSGPRGATSPAASTIAISVASQQSGVLTGTLVWVSTDTLCYFAVGANPTAVLGVSMPLLPTDGKVPIPITDQDKLAVIGVNGNIYFHPVVAQDA